MVLFGNSLYHGSQTNLLLLFLTGDLMSEWPSASWSETPSSFAQSWHFRLDSAGWLVGAKWCANEFAYFIWSSSMDVSNVGLCSAVKVFMSLAPSTCSSKVRLMLNTHNSTRFILLTAPPISLMIWAWPPPTHRVWEESYFNSRRRFCETLSEVAQALWTLADSTQAYRARCYGGVTTGAVPQHFPKARICLFQKKPCSAF